MFWALKAHLLEQARQTCSFQSQVAHPRSEGLAVLDGEKTHCPELMSYPSKQVRQSPEALSKVLHWALTATQSPSALKKLLAEHSMQASLDQMLHRRFDSGTMLVSTEATQLPFWTMDP